MTKLKSVANATLLAALAASGLCFAAAPQGLRDYRALAINAAGDRLAAIEAVDPGGLPKRPHANIIVRDASGKVLSTYDPCASCNYDFPSFSPDQKALSFIGTDAKAGTATLYVVSDGKVATLTTVK